MLLNVTVSLNAMEQQYETNMSFKKNIKKNMFLKLRKDIFKINKQYQKFKKETLETNQEILKTDSFRFKNDFYSRLATEGDTPEGLTKAIKRYQTENPGERDELRNILLDVAFMK